MISYKNKFLIFLALGCLLSFIDSIILANTELRNSIWVIPPILAWLLFGVEFYWVNSIWSE